MSKLVLKQTCAACPESYDAYHEGEWVGDMRLRHGYFRATCKGITVHESHPRGDGVFEYDERTECLNSACAAIIEAMREGSKRVEDLFTIEYGES